MPKPRIVRVVTASYVVPWHLDNTLRRITSDFDVTVVGQGVSSNEAAYPGIEWVDIDLNRKISVFADLRALWQLCRLFRARKPDIVHSIMPKAGLISALAGFICRVPIRVHTFTGQIWTNRRPVARLVLYLLDRTINALNTVCLTDSPSQSQLLYRHGFSSHGLPLPVLGQGSLSGVDFSRFDQSGQDARRKQLRTDLGIGEQDFVFAFVARKSREKGAIDMIRAFSQVTAAHEVARLLFVGPDESSGELAAMRKDTPALFKNVDDIGQVPDHERYLAISQVLCLPSYREGFGSIVIDAAATGVPVIGSDIAGLVDSIENGKTGLLIPPGNIGKLVQAMLSMLENPQDCRQMGFAARHRAEDLFAADKMYALLRDFYFVKLSEKP